MKHNNDPIIYRQKLLSEIEKLIAEYLNIYGPDNIITYKTDEEKGLPIFYATIKSE